MFKKILIFICLAITALLIIFIVFFNDIKKSDDTPITSTYDTITPTYDPVTPTFSCDSEKCSTIVYSVFYNSYDNVYDGYPKYFIKYDPSGISTVSDKDNNVNNFQAGILPTFEIEFVGDMFYTEMYYVDSRASKAWQEYSIILPNNSKILQNNGGCYSTIDNVTSCYKNNGPLYFTNIDCNDISNGEIKIDGELTNDGLFYIYWDDVPDFGICYDRYEYNYKKEGDDNWISSSTEDNYIYIEPVDTSNGIKYYFKVIPTSVTGSSYDGKESNILELNLYVPVLR